ncbi:MAG: hypothetical protein AAGD25_28340 [Cyanobacteria bacterium P01_F01_bin.150]
MGFITVTHWPIIPVDALHRLASTPGMAEPEGLWFRAMGVPQNGGVINTEVWATAVAWQQANDRFMQQSKCQALSEQYGVEAPTFTLQAETMATFTRSDLGGYPQSVWLNPQTPGNAAFLVFPNITVEDYRRGMAQIGFREGIDEPAIEGLLYTAEGPYAKQDWAVLRVWETIEQRRNYVNKYRHIIRQFIPKGTLIRHEFSLQHFYFTAACPTGAHNQITPGLFH